MNTQNIVEETIEDIPTNNNSKSKALKVGIIGGGLMGIVGTNSIM